MGVTIGHALHQAGLQSGREEVLGRELAGSVRASWVDESYKDVAEHKKGRRVPSASASLGVFSSRVTDYFSCLRTAWAAARRAIGTRNGEQDT